MKIEKKRIEKKLSRKFIPSQIGIWIWFTIKKQYICVATHIPLAVLRLTFHWWYLSDYASSVVLRSKLIKFRALVRYSIGSVMSKTNMVMAVNDVNEVGHYDSELLLQCYEGLYLGVKDTGFFATNAGLLMKTNKDVKKR